jgi:hypothetical protein
MPLHLKETIFKRVISMTHYGMHLGVGERPNGEPFFVRYTRTETERPIRREERPVTVSRKPNWKLYAFATCAAAVVFPTIAGLCVLVNDVTRIPELENLQPAFTQAQPPVRNISTSYAQNSATPGFR